MKRVIIALMFVLSLAVSIHCQDRLLKDTRVAVLPLWFKENDQSGAILSQTVQTTIGFLLKVIEGYELVEPAQYPRGQRELMQFIESNRLDNVIYGRVDSEGESFTISLLLYETKSDKVLVVEQGSVKTNLETFELADNLSTSLLEKFLGRKLDFGSLAFSNIGGGPGGFEVFINDKSFGQNLKRIDKFLVGTYRLKIDQVNGSDRLPLLSRDFTVGKDATTSLEFGLIKYARLTVLLQGPEREARVLLNGEKIPTGPQAPRLLPAGSYSLSFRQSDPEGDELTVEEKTVKLESERSEEIVFTRLAFGRGLAFAPRGASGRFSVLIDGRAAGDNLDRIKTLPVGPKAVEVRQVFADGREWVVFKGDVMVGEGERPLVAFDLYENYEQANEASRIIEFSLELQLFNAAFFWAGVNVDLRQLRLNGALLLGASANNDGLVYCLEAKMHYRIICLGDFTPYAGAAVFLNLVSGRFESLAGPQLGCSWSIGNSILSEAFLETGLFYKFGAGLPLYLRFALGVRLWKPE